LPDTALPVLDFTPLAACATIVAGATSVTFTVATRADNRPEGSERLWLLTVADPRVADLTDPIAAGTVVNQ
jgi:hypothetical protein